MSKILNVRNNIKSESSNVNPEIGNLFDSFFVKIILLAVTGFIFFSVYNSFNITFQKLEILKQAEREVEELRIKNLHLSIGMKDMSTDTYLEKEARDRLNFGKEGEIVFVLPKNSLELANEQVKKITQGEQEEVYRNGYNFTEWISFVMEGV
jgi:cell division protein FtsB